MGRWWRSLCQSVTVGSNRSKVMSPRASLKQPRILARYIVVAGERLVEGARIRPKRHRPDRRCSKWWLFFPAGVDRGLQRSQSRRCAFHSHATLRRSSAGLSPLGRRPSRIASTMSGARQVGGRSRHMSASVTPSWAPGSAIDFALPPPIDGADVLSPWSRPYAGPWRQAPRPTRHPDVAG